MPTTFSELVPPLRQGQTRVRCAKSGQARIVLIRASRLFAHAGDGPRNDPQQLARDAGRGPPGRQRRGPRLRVRQRQRGQGHRRDEWLPPCRVVAIAGSLRRSAGTRLPGPSLQSRTSRPSLEIHGYKGEKLRSFVPTLPVKESRPEQVLAVPAERQDTPELRRLVPAYNAPYYEQWIGPWEILPDALTLTLELFRKTDRHIHLQQQASMGGGTPTVQARRESDESGLGLRRGHGRQRRLLGGLASRADHRPRNGPGRRHRHVWRGQSLGIGTSLAPAGTGPPR